MRQQMQASAYHLKPADIKKLTVVAVNFRNRCVVKSLWWLKSQGFMAEWVQNFLGHEPYKTTMDMYETMAIDEMQEVAARKLGD
ncbi:MAG: hypothetical protein ETSY2_18580 [Candidatus Entotheonella gemina]|uniref:Uncharacterized protein n=1 Tax=Candidatus Entotheonella gemina TaxID=1429439 RepID=W4M7P3_9BACT|nr:MAG: hypothetical protein ETSY2_18580 [Candidatus Entotheonella gemina]